MFDRVDYEIDLKTISRITYRYGYKIVLLLMIHMLGTNINVHYVTTGSDGDGGIG